MATTTSNASPLGLSFTSFPKLEINPRDVHGSWKSFLSKFSLALKYQVIAAGTKKVEDADVALFTDDMKVLALLNSVGDEGLRVLESQGIQFDAADLQYGDVIDALKNHYGREESLNIRVHKFVHAQQLSSEDSRDYLRRVEHLSRSISVFKCEDHDMAVTDANQKKTANQLGDKIREILALTAVVNGLRDTKLRRELMAKENLTWNLLCKILTARGSADESSVKLDRPVNQQESLISPENIKQEVAFSRFGNSNNERRGRFPSNSRDRSYSRDRFRGRSYSRDRYSRHDSRDRFQRRDSRERSSRFSKHDSDDRSSFARHDSSDRYSKNYGRNYSRERFPSRDRDRNSGSFNRERDFSPRSQNYSSSKTVCFYCNERGHIIHNCPKITCVICNDRGHTSIECKKSRDSRSSTKSVRDVQHDGPRSLRSRSPSPYPERGRKDTPSHYINRVSIDPRTIAFSHDA